MDGMVAGLVALWSNIGWSLSIKSARRIADAPQIKSGEEMNDRISSPNLVYNVALHFMKRTP